MDSDARPRAWWRRPLLIAHIVTAAGLIGADLSLLTLGVAVLGGANPQAIYPAASHIASWVIGPLVLAVLAIGVAQAILSGWGLLRYWWVAIKLAVTLVFTAVVWFVLVPRLAGSAAAAAGDEAFTTAERLPLAIVPSLAVALLIILTALAVYKPRRRLRVSRKTGP